MHLEKVYIGSQVQALRDLHKAVIAGNYYKSGMVDVLAVQAEAILDAHRDGNRAVTFHLACWCPDFIGQAADKIMASNIELNQARLTIAREHGFADWDEVKSLKNVTLDSEFERTVDALLSGDVQQLGERLRANPELVRQASQYGHRATLLHYIGANGVESYRQITPLNAVEVVQTLLDAGADVNAPANIYGGSTTLGLVSTSAHPHNAGVAHEIATLLKSAGAH